MRKNYKKILCLLLMASVVGGFSGCTKQSEAPKDTEIVKEQVTSSVSNKEDKKGKNDKTSGTTNSIVSSDPNFLAPTIIASPTDNSAIVNVLPSKDMKVYVEYGTEVGNYSNKTTVEEAKASTTMEINLTNLQGNSRYYYRVNYSLDGTNYQTTTENSFMTERAPGSTFTFGIQGDSHPERSQQFSSELYTVTMQNIMKDNPDFYLTIGDDFSVDKLTSPTKESVESLYLNQRQFLGQVGASSPLFLVNGNHEQAAKYVLDGTPNNVAVWGQNARNTIFSQPLPNDFYTGDEEEVDNIGKLRDYYAWNWGDALFVVIDPYWHSEVAVDNALGGRDKNNDTWGVTLGDEQYTWFKKTLEESTAKYKFVFTHHVLGTGRGGTDQAEYFEWGGYDKNGSDIFASKRPTWEMPIQDLMAENDVTIFFQGHDHIFVKQELDGVIYQSLPQPADPNYALNNSDAYESDAKYPSSGYVRVTVSSEDVKVDYVKSLLPKDEVDGAKNGDIIYSYSVTGK